MYSKNSRGWLKHFDFILLDLACLQLAFVLSYVARHGVSNPYGSQVYLGMALFLVFADIAVIFFGESYSGVLKRGAYEELSRTLRQAVSIEVLAMVYLFTVKDAEAYSRSSLYLMAPFYVAVSYACRLLWKRFLRSRRKSEGKRSILIISTGDIASDVVDNLTRHNLENFSIAGLVLADRDGRGTSVRGIPVVANAGDVTDYICKNWVDEVFVNLSEDHAFPQELVNQVAETGVTVHLNLARVAETAGRKQLVEKIAGYTVLTTSMNYVTQGQAFMKRALDIAGGLVGCLLTAVLTVFVAPAIYIQSPGPVFFSQIRVGKNGKEFKLYKFRSMYPDAEQRKEELMKYNRVKDGTMFKMDFDPRVIGNKVLPDGERKTGIGEFIRKTSIDEFPQFWNVLMGQMSLVGTRPPLPREVEAYSKTHRARLAVKPGITGMWQVSGRSNITDFDEVVKLDTKYITEWSFWLDLKILAKTVAMVFTGEGAM